MKIGELIYVNEINYESFKGRELKPFSCRQVQDHLRFIDFTSERDVYICVFCSYVHSMNHMYAYSRDDRKIKFRMVSAQHFINEAPELHSCEGKYVSTSI